jgi:hypothetical protein
MKWIIPLVLTGLGFLAIFAFRGPDPLAAVTARVDRLEKDNALQQQIITDLGDKVAAHLTK